MSDEWGRNRRRRDTGGGTAGKGDRGISSPPEGIVCPSWVLRGGDSRPSPGAAALHGYSVPFRGGGCPPGWCHPGITGVCGGSHGPHPGSSPTARAPWLATPLPLWERGFVVGWVGAGGGPHPPPPLPIRGEGESRCKHAAECAGERCCVADWHCPARAGGYYALHGYFAGAAYSVSQNYLAVP